MGIDLGGMKIGVSFETAGSFGAFGAAVAGLEGLRIAEWGNVCGSSRYLVVVFG